MLARNGTRGPEVGTGTTDILDVIRFCAVMGKAIVVIVEAGREMLLRREWGLSDGLMW